MKKRIISVILSCIMCVMLFASCAGSSSSSSSGSASTDASTTAVSGETTKGEDKGSSGENVTIQVFSNLPDRTSGQGLVEQKIFDQYMAENKNVTIKVEALDDEAYKTKFKAYASGTSMPDLVSVWGQPAFIDEVIDAGLLAELNESDYSDYGFIENSLSGFSKNGKLYGLARNTDVMAFFYNKAIFEKNNWTIPNTYDELLELAKKIKDKGLIPVAMDGSDKWPISIFLTDLMVKINGAGAMDKVAESIAKKDWSDPMYAQAAKLLQDAYDAGLFQTGFETTDYATAMNLFANGQSAMYYMGSWEMSMATSPDVPAEVKENIRAFTMPTVADGKGTKTDISAWNGGGHSVTANSAVKDEAIKLLNYMYLPDNWTKISWENNVGMSAQDFSKYKTGSETPVQLEFIDTVSNMSSISGTPLNDRGNSEYKTKCEDLSQELSIKKITPEQFVTDIQAAS